MKDIEQDRSESLEFCRQQLEQAGYKEFNIELMLSDSHDGELVHMRSLVVYILRLRNYTFQRIGKIIGRGHPAVINLSKEDRKTAYSYVYDQKIRTRIARQMQELDLNEELIYHKSNVERIERLLELKKAS